MAANVRTVILLLCLGTCAGLPGYPLPIDDAPTGGVAEDPPGNAWAKGDQFGLKSGGKVYYVQNSGADNWWGAGFVRFDLRGKTLSFTADLQGVQCGVVATLYFVAMGNPGPGAPYCDIQPGRGWNPCFEIDVMEANAHAFHSSLHAEQGTAADGSCNARIGCVANVGRYPFTTSGIKTGDLYGPGSPGINSMKPFEVVAKFDDNGTMAVHLEQDGKMVPIFNKTSAGNLPAHPNPWDWKSYQRPGGIPDKAIWETKGAFDQGLVMVSTLWAGDTHWLDDFACQGQPQGNLGASWFSIQGLAVHSNSKLENPSGNLSSNQTDAGINASHAEATAVPISIATAAPATTTETPTTTTQASTSTATSTLTEAPTTITSTSTVSESTQTVTETAGPTSTSAAQALLIPMATIPPLPTPQVTEAASSTSTSAAQASLPPLVTIPPLPPLQALPTLPPPPTLPPLPTLAVIGLDISADRGADRDLPVLGLASVEGPGRQRSAEFPGAGPLAMLLAGCAGAFALLAFLLPRLGQVRFPLWSAHRVNPGQTETEGLLDDP